MKNRKKKKATPMGKAGITVMAIAITAILSVQAVRLNHKDAEYRQQKAQLEAQLAQEQAVAEQLQEQEKFIGSEEYVEQIARTKLGMVYSDEILFKEK